jgi:hypothetical protein
MKKSKALSSGSPEKIQDTMTDQKKPTGDAVSGSFTIETVSGRLIDPANPSPDSISLTDIAWSLSRLPRFAGHTITKIPYNVAQHCVYVSELVERILNGEADLVATARDHQEANALMESITRVKYLGISPNAIMWGLLHDAHEAYIGDIPSPVKKIPGVRTVIKQLEEALDAAIVDAFSLDPDDIEMCYPLVKHADKLAQAIESYQYMPSRGKEWGLPIPTVEMLHQFPAPLSPLESYEAFLKRYTGIHL